MLGQCTHWPMLEWCRYCCSHAWVHIPLLMHTMTHAWTTGAPLLLAWVVQVLLFPCLGACTTSCLADDLPSHAWVMQVLPSRWGWSWRWEWFHCCTCIHQTATYQKA